MISRIQIHVKKKSFVIFHKNGGSFLYIFNKCLEASGFAVDS